MSNYKKQLGNVGETFAKQYLLTKGFLFLQQNFRFKKSEIDLIFKDGNDVVFVEVKTRNDISNIDFNSLVSKRQQKMLRFGAAAFLNNYIEVFDEARFDIVVVSSNFKNISYISNAF